jgi:uncharacterized protein
MAHPNELAVRKAYEAFAAGDMETIRSLFDPEITWHVVGRSPLAGTYQGVDAALGFLGQIVQMTEGTFTAEVQDVLANDEHAVTLAHIHAHRAGKTLESEEAHVVNVKDGRIMEFWALTEDQYAVDEFFS